MKISLPQKAVVWTFQSSDKYGEETVATGTEVSCRWESHLQDIQRADGTTITSDTLVFLTNLPPLRSLLWFGAEADLPDPLSGITDLYEVVEQESVPELKGNSNVNCVLLKRYGNTLPTISS